MGENISYIPQQPYIPAEGVSKVSPNKVPLDKDSGNIAFDDLLQKEISGNKEIKFSGHAQSRLRTRNINFTESQMQRISNAVDKAEQKGSRDSLLLVDNVAAVVSVENRTVVTVVDEASLKDNVFTNIDSAVIA